MVSFFLRLAWTWETVSLTQGLGLFSMTINESRYLTCSPWYMLLIRIDILNGEATPRDSMSHRFRNRRGTGMPKWLNNKTKFIYSTAIRSDNSSESNCHPTITLRPKNLIGLRTSRRCSRHMYSARITMLM